MTDAVKAALLSAAADRTRELKQQVMSQLLQAGAPEGLRFAEDMLNGKDHEQREPGGVGARRRGHARGQAADRARARLEGRRASGSPRSRRSCRTPTSKSTDTLVRLATDPDAQVRATALSTLGQVGSERAQQAIFEATRSGQARGPRRRDRRPVVDR